MTNQEAKDIATVLIAKTAICFDDEAFTDCKPPLSENDKDKIIREIEKISQQMIFRIQKKLDVDFRHSNSSHEIIDLILYEN